MARTASAIFFNFECETMRGIPETSSYEPRSVFVYITSISRGHDQICNTKLLIDRQGFRG